MKTLRRPMFRKGGEVGGGIMTGINRENYQQGTTAERLMQFARPTGFDPVSQFLIQGGMNLASKGSTGSGVIADAFSAFKEPTTNLMANLGKQDELKQQIGLKGELIDIEQEGALKLAREKEKYKLGNERRKAIAVAGPRKQDETEEDYLKRVDAIESKLILSPITAAENVMTRFEIGQKNDALASIMKDQGLGTKDAANKFYNFENNILPELRSQNPEYKNLTFIGTVTAKKDTGKYQLKNKKPGIYFDPFLENVIIIDAARDAKILRANQL